LAKKKLPDSYSHNVEKFKKLSNTVLILGKKHKDKILDEVPFDYLAWMANKFKVWGDDKDELANLVAVKEYVKEAQKRGLDEKEGEV